MSQSEIERLRIDDDRRHQALTRAGRSPAVGAACRVATVSTGGANQFCAVTFDTVTGTETAGSAGTLTGADTGVALNLGGSDPTGKAVICTSTDYRWVFRYD